MTQVLDGPTTLDAKEPLHFAFVDSLRGFAILGVIVAHSMLIVPAVNSKVEVFARSGVYFVQLFFVVSAFTLFWSLRSRSSTDARPLHAFYVRRIFRIGPLFWLAAAFYGSQTFFWRARYAPNGIGIWHILTTLTFLHGWYPSTMNSLVPGGWSIAAEFMFYLSIPVLFHRVKSLRSALWVTLISAWLWILALPIIEKILDRHFPPSWHWLIGQFLNFSFPSQFPVFSLGAVLYFLIAQRSDKFSGQSIRAGLSPFFMICLAIFLLGNEVPIHIWFAACFVLIAYSLSIRPYRVIVNRFTQYMGMISFSGYIWHFWLLDHTSSIVFKLLPLKSFAPRLAGTIQFAVIFLLTLTAILPVASCSYFLIEAPGQQFGKRIIVWLGWGRRKVQAVSNSFEAETVPVP